MTFGNDRENLLFAEWESVGEDEVRLRLNSNTYSPVDRQLMQSWLDIKESKRNLDFQEKNTLIQKWILRLTIAIFILTLISVVFAVLPYKPLDMHPHSQTTTPQKENQTQQTRILKSSGNTKK